MTVFKILFVVFLVIPIAACMFFFVSRMFGDLRQVRNVKYEDVEGQNTIKKQKKKHKKRPPEEPEYIEREVVRQPYYTSPQVQNQAYPSDPYAGYRRPDLDSYIRSANERDRAARESLMEDDGVRRTSRGKKPPAKRKAKAKAKPKAKARSKKRTTTSKGRRS